MLIPKYWAECVIKNKTRGRQIIVRRFGWSMESMEDAQKLAAERANEAFVKKSTGDKTIAHREAKVAYNGSEGLPIREEILSINNNDVITRNAYGAHCLNTPSTLFIDVDFDKSPAPAAYICLILLIGVAVLYAVTAYSLSLFAFAAIILSVPIAKTIGKKFIYFKNHTG